MKTALFSLFLSSLLLSATAEVVLDTDGDLLRNGGTYHIVSAFRGGFGGGVQLARTGNETCPLSVVLRGPDTNLGFPVRLESILRIPYISTGLSLKLEFTIVPPCATKRSSQWTVADLDGSEFVKIPGYDNPVLGWFLIERASSEPRPFYRLRFSHYGETGEQVALGESRHLVVSDDEKYLSFLCSFRKVGPYVA